MNKYTYEQIEIGLTESFEVLITEDMMKQFLTITGDSNPLHCDKKYASERGFKDRVVYGMLTSSFYSTLVGMYLPGKYALLQSVETKLLQMVFIGDKLRIEGKVAKMNDAFQVIIIKAVITNQHGEKVSKAIIQTGIINNSETL